MGLLKISVVIPAYNAEKYIKRAIRSVINQTLKPHEIIVVDDGSLDNTYSIVSKNFPDIILYKQDNQGPSAARNLGIKNSSGDWITFLDADDEWMPDLLESYTNILLKYEDLMWCCTPYLIETENNKTEIRYSGSQLKGNVIINILIAYKDFKQISFAELISTCSVIIHKNVFDTVGYFNTSFKCGEDIDLWFRISLKYKTIGYINELGFKYLKENDNSLTSSIESFDNIKNQILRIHSSWMNIKNYNEIVLQNSKYILNIWCWRILKAIVRNQYFVLVKYFSTEVIKKLNIKNKVIFYILSKFINK